MNQCDPCKSWIPIYLYIVVAIIVLILVLILPNIDDRMRANLMAYFAAGIIFTIILLYVALQHNNYIITAAIIAISLIAEIFALVWFNMNP